MYFDLRGDDPSIVPFKSLGIDAPHVFEQHSNVAITLVERIRSSGFIHIKNIG